MALSKKNSELLRAYINKVALNKHLKVETNKDANTKQSGKKSK